MNPFAELEFPLPNPPALNPTTLATAASVRALLASCDASFGGIRDRAIIRVMWATGARPSSVATMTMDRLHLEGGDLIATVIAKGNRDLPVLIRGAARSALEQWLSVRSVRWHDKNELWLTEEGTQLSRQSIWRDISMRTRAAGIGSRLTPMSFRVAFVTYNPARLDSKRAALGHLDSSTTLIYDRDIDGSHRRDAFFQMPDPEDFASTDNNQG